MTSQRDRLAVERREGNGKPGIHALRAENGTDGVWNRNGIRRALRQRRIAGTVRSVSVSVSVCAASFAGDRFGFGAV